MKTTLSNQRMCVITRVKKDKLDLTKITRIDNIWNIDYEYNLFGRSIYIDLNENNLKKFKKQVKRFKMTDENFSQIVEGLEGLIEHSKN